jgi:hypothetical protein
MTALFETLGAMKRWEAHVDELEAEKAKRKRK